MLSGIIALRNNHYYYYSFENNLSLYARLDFFEVIFFKIDIVILVCIFNKICCLSNISNMQFVVNLTGIWELLGIFFVSCLRNW